MMNRVNFASSLFYFSLNCAQGKKRKVRRERNQNRDCNNCPFEHIRTCINVHETKEMSHVKMGEPNLVSLYHPVSC